MKYSRLKNKSTFNSIYKTGRQLNGRLFKAFFIPQADKVEIGVVASSKVGKAVQRNRARRLLRSALQKAGVAKQGFSMVLLAKKEILACKAPEVFENLEQMFKRFRVN